MHLFQEAKMFQVLEERKFKEEFKKTTAKHIRSLKHPNIISIGSMKNDRSGIIVKINSDENTEQVLTSLTELFKEQSLIVNKKKYGRYSNVLEVNHPDKIGILNVIIRSKMSERNGIILEELIAFLLSTKPTNRLKNILKLPEDSNSIDIMTEAMDKYENIFEIATFAKKLIKDKISNIKSVKVLNDMKRKADLEVIDIDDNIYGISVKMSLDKDTRYEYNKNLGFGNEESSLIPSPSGKPWWLIGRMMFVKALKRKTGLNKEYKPNPTDLSAPRWLVKAKEENPEIYKQVLVDLYSTIRETFFTKLRSMSVKKLADIAYSSRMGNQSERNRYKSFFVLTYDKRGVTIDKISKQKENFDNLTSSRIVKKKGNRIVIDFPNIEPITISSVRLNMLDNNKESLKVKTK
jgi:hypothetical protein